MNVVVYVCIYIHLSPLQSLGMSQTSVHELWVTFQVLGFENECRMLAANEIGISKPSESTRIFKVHD